ncbi:MAG: CpsD/CapB family tyrosine-protein kinase [Candidatus Acidiferrum sp.]
MQSESTMNKTKTEFRCEIITSKSFKPSPDGELNGFRILTPVIGEDSRLVLHTDPNGLVAEQFRLLRRNLNQEFPNGATLMITSPGMGDGKTLTSLNFCTCLAETGDSTLLVEVDIRRPAVAQTLGCIAEQPGIEDALTAKVDPGAPIRLVKGLKFHAAIVANVPNDPSRLMNGDAVKEFITWARQHFRWVVLDSPPVLPVADVSALLPFTDGVLLIVRAQQTPQELSKKAIEILGKRLHGVIFNEVTSDTNSYYRYLDHYYTAGHPTPRIGEAG